MFVELKFWIDVRLLLGKSWLMIIVTSYYLARDAPVTVGLVIVVEGCTRWSVCSSSIVDFLLFLYINTINGSRGKACNASDGQSAHLSLQN